MRSGAALPLTDPAAARRDRTGPSAPCVRGRLVIGMLLVSGAILLGGCTADVPPADPTTAPTASAAATATGSPAAAGVTEPRAQLAALAAAAEDRHLTASYTLSRSGQPDRTVVLTSAADGTWRVDIPGGALGGTADVAIAQTRAGIFQCALASAGGTTTCVKVAAPDQAVPANVDPRVQHVFTDWREVLTDRQASLAVATSLPLPNSRGACFSVDSTAASLSAPLDVGIYCFDTDGTLTAARVAFGTLLLTGTPTAAPQTVTLPGSVVAGPALRTAAPPTPSAGVTPSSTPTS